MDVGFSAEPSLTSQQYSRRQQVQWPILWQYAVDFRSVREHLQHQIRFHHWYHHDWSWFLAVAKEGGYCRSDPAEKQRLQGNILSWISSGEADRPLLVKEDLFEPFFLEKAATAIFGGYCMALFSSQKKNGIIDSKNTSFGGVECNFYNRTFKHRSPVRGYECQKSIGEVDGLLYFFLTKVLYRRRSVQDCLHRSD